MTAKKAYYYDTTTGDPIDEEDALECGIMKDGVALKVPMYMRDSDGNALILTDAMGEPLDPRWNRRGFVFVDNADRSHPIDNSHPDVQKAYISSAWNGGVKPGDVVNINGRQMIGTHFTDEGDVEFVDIQTLDANELKKRAYDEYKRHVSGNWKKQKEPKEIEWEVAGPLSDGRSVSDAESSEIKEQAWRDAVTDLENAWRR